MKLPEYNKSKKTGNQGLQIVKSIIEGDHNWLFRKIDLEDDYGLDGYIDLLEDGKYITGKTIAVQIKTGKSYFSHPTNYGWSFYGDDKHINYYLNLDLPVIVILVDLDLRKAYWNKVDINSIQKTDKAWKFVIPKTNDLENKELLKNVTNSYIDYTQQIEKLTEINQAILNSETCFIAVERHEVENNIYDGFDKLLQWLTNSEKMIIENRGKFFISIFGYDDDPRELFEIDEVRTWMTEVLKRFKYWGYFLHMNKQARGFSSLLLLASCCTKINYISKDVAEKKNYVEYDMEESIKFKESIFHWLNEFCVNYGITEQVNFEQSMKIAQILDGLSDEDIERIKTNMAINKIHIIE